MAEKLIGTIPSLKLNGIVNSLTKETKAVFFITSNVWSITDYFT